MAKISALVPFFHREFGPEPFLPFAFQGVTCVYLSAFLNIK